MEILITAVRAEYPSTAWLCSTPTIGSITAAMKKSALYVNSTYQMIFKYVQLIINGNLWRVSWSFLPRDVAMLTRSWLSNFCPSVRLPDTRIICMLNDRTKGTSSNILIPYVIAITLVFCHQQL